MLNGMSSNVLSSVLIMDKTIPTATEPLMAKLLSVDGKTLIDQIAAPSNAATPLSICDNVFGPDLVLTPGAKNACCLAE